MVSPSAVLLRCIHRSYVADKYIRRADSIHECVFVCLLHTVLLHTAASAAASRTATVRFKFNNVSVLLAICAGCLVGWLVGDWLALLMGKISARAVR